MWNNLLADTTDFSSLHTFCASVSTSYLLVYFVVYCVVYLCFQGINFVKVLHIELFNPF